MQCDTEDNSRWERRETKKKTRKNFSSDNRRSVRWLLKKSGEKARDIQKAREQKEKEKEVPQSI